MNELTQQIIIGTVLLVAGLYLFYYYRRKKSEKSGCKQCPAFNASVEKEKKS